MWEISRCHPKCQLLNVSCSRCHLYTKAVFYLPCYCCIDEYLAVDGTIINFSSVDLGGTLPQLSWGKWVTTPTFPIKSSTQQHFKCCGVRFFSCHLMLLNLVEGSNSYTLLALRYGRRSPRRFYCLIHWHARTQPI